MSVTYGVDMSQVQAIAGEMESITHHIRQLILSLEEEASSSLQHWTGDAKATYAECKAKWDNAAHNMATAAAKATTSLVQINQAYNTGERQGVGMWQGA
ncbi:WXG100 family type VII secretion target [Streptomyces sp. NPDC006476]|uniref:WXG100 family type VII secretion target n=1 Tax=Streptomyces sp. NPDC006476 TaxID=3157175 RepID=UPI0033AA17B3